MLNWASLVTCSHFFINKLIFNVKNLKMYDYFIISCFALLLFYLFIFHNNFSCINQETLYYIYRCMFIFQFRTISAIVIYLLLLYFLLVYFAFACYCHTQIDITTSFRNHFAIQPLYSNFTMIVISNVIKILFDTVVSTTIFYVLLPPTK